jgi:outer membrane protein
MVLRIVITARRGVFAAGLLMMSMDSVGAETLPGALGRAYNNNPTLNAQRAALRATNETVSQALSGYRPRINSTADLGFQTDTTRGQTGLTTDNNYTPRGIALTVDQNLWNGNRTPNRVRQAESTVLSGRETLRNTEQTVLFAAVTAYMNVLRDSAILNLRRNNIEVIEEQLRQVRDRFNVGEVTRTDVAQAENRLAGARAQAALAEANLKAAIATFRQQIGVEPKQLAAGTPIDKLLPKSVQAALNLALSGHPAIRAAMHGVDAAQLNVKVIEGELYPSLNLRGTLSQRWDLTASNIDRTSASIVGALTIPIYEGGEVYSRTRQAKETLGQQRINVDIVRDQVRQAVVAAWGALEATRAQVLAATAQVKAAETALAGVREEAKVGQRTTLDVLNAQQELLDARVNLITAQRDRVVASYQVLQTIGRLNAASLGLKVAVYDPVLHYKQVKDKWWGLRTPDGR